MTTTHWAEPTGYSIGQCPNCKTRIMAETSTAMKFETGRVIMRCPTDQCPGRTWGVACKRIMGRYSDKRSCGPRCTSAVGPNCDCQCGGKNHSIDLRM